MGKFNVINTKTINTDIINCKEYNNLPITSGDKLGIVKADNITCVSRDGVISVISEGNGPVISEHINNAEIHLTDAKNKLLNDFSRHDKNNTIHVTKEDKDKLNKAVEDLDLHISNCSNDALDKLIKRHVNDTSMHLGIESINSLVENVQDWLSHKFNNKNHESNRLVVTNVDGNVVTLRELDVALVSKALANVDYDLDESLKRKSDIEHTHTDLTSLMTEINGNLATILESIDNLKTTTDEHKESITALTESVDGLKANVEEFKTNFENINSTIVKMQAEIESIKSNLPTTGQ